MLAAIPAFLLFTLTIAQNVPLRGPPQFELNPQYLDSYIPASMQIIAYLTEMMKYDIKPIVTSTTTTSTKRPTITTPRVTMPTTTKRGITTKQPLYTPRPTPYHKPALYAPYHPPGFHAYRRPSISQSSQTEDEFEAYVNRLKNPLGDYFDRYRNVDPITSIIDQLSRGTRAAPFNYTPTSTKRTSVASARVDNTQSGRPKRATRPKRAKPFMPNTNNTAEPRLQNGERKRVNISLKANAKKTIPSKKPSLERSRSIRSTDKLPSDITDDATNIESAPLRIDVVAIKQTPDIGKDKPTLRALNIDGANFNARSVDYLGFGLNELIKAIQSEDSVGNGLTDDDRVKVFSTKYDDVNFGSYLLRQKKIPPTRAYVTLLSLYDLLNKESKKLMLNRYNGYSSAVIEELIETSSGTSSEQLKIILQRIIDRPDTSDADIRKKITTLVADLSTTNSYINDALRYIPPLAFSR